MYWTSSPRAVLLACTPMRISPSLYTSALEWICSRSWLCDFLVIPNFRHSWILFIRLFLTVPLLRSCCISYSIDALACYSTCRLICFLNRFFIFGTCLFWSNTYLLLPLSGNSMISVDIFLCHPIILFILFYIAFWRPYLPCPAYSIRHNACPALRK